jgi:hypothetical protein
MPTMCPGSMPGRLRSTGADQRHAVTAETDGEVEIEKAGVMNEFGGPDIALDGVIDATDGTPIYKVATVPNDEVRAVGEIVVGSDTDDTWVMIVPGEDGVYEVAVAAVGDGLRFRSDESRAVGRGGRT